MANYNNAEYITEAIQCELDKIARYHDQVEVIEKYFAAKR